MNRSKASSRSGRDSGNTACWPRPKTKPSDATLADFRALRRKELSGLNGRLAAYYLDSTWETNCRPLRPPPSEHVYQRLPDGTAVLAWLPHCVDGRVRLTARAAAATSRCGFRRASRSGGCGEHAAALIDTSEHVWFANDQFAVRFNRRNRPRLAAVCQRRLDSRQQVEWEHETWSVEAGCVVVKYAKG